MKTKLLIITALTLLTLSCKQNNAPKKAAAGNENQQAIEMLTEFYTLYMTEQDKMPPDLQAIEKIEHKFITQEFLKKLKSSGLEYDPFLNAQDCSIDWIKTLEITSVQEKENAYKVCYHYDNEHTNCMTLYLITENGNFMINGIEDLSGALTEEDIAIYIQDPMKITLYRPNEEVYENNRDFIGLFATSGAAYRLQPTKGKYHVGYNDCWQDSVVTFAPVQGGCLVMIAGLSMYNNKPVQSAIEKPFEMLPDESLPFTSGDRTYTLQATCANSDFRESSTLKDYYLYISQKGKPEKQQLLTISEVQGTVPEILFIGDIDGDGLPDLLINATSNYENRRLVLFLSSFAGEKELLHLVGEDPYWFDC